MKKKKEFFKKFLKNVPTYLFAEVIDLMLFYILHL